MSKKRALEYLATFMAIGFEFFLSIGILLNLYTTKNEELMNHFFDSTDYIEINGTITNEKIDKLKEEYPDFKIHVSDTNSYSFVVGNYALDIKDDKYNMDVSPDNFVNTFNYYETLPSYLKIASGRLPSKKGELCFNSSLIDMYKRRGFYDKETKEEIKGENINVDKFLNRNIKIRSYKNKTYEEFKIVGFYTYIGKNTIFENFSEYGVMYKDDISNGPYESAFIEANDKKAIIDFYNKHCQEGKSRMYFYISYSGYAFRAEVEKITTFSILMLIIPAIIGFCGLSFSIVRGGIVQNRDIDFECLPKKLTVKEGNKIVFRNICYGIIGLLIGYFTSIPFTYMEMSWYTENVMRYFLSNSYYLYSSLIVLFYILLYTIISIVIRIYNKPYIKGNY